MSLGAVVIRRLAAGAIVLWATATAVFVAMHLAPGDLVSVLIGEGPESPGVRHAVASEWDLDAPVPAQYLHFMGQLLTGHLGTSYRLHLPVGHAIGSQLGPTAALAGLAAVFAVCAAVLSATLTAGRPRLRRVAGTTEIAAAAIPEFWLGIVLLFVFSFSLHWFPVAGASGFASLVLPALALGVGVSGTLSQVLREGLERALEQPFALTVRSRGVSDLALRWRHGLRHAGVPAVTLAAWLVGELLGGAVVVEQVFGRPGLGQLTLSAVQSRDVPVVLGIALLAAAVYVVVSTLADLLSALIDPRLRDA